MFWIMALIILVAFIVVTEIAVAREDKEWQREREVRQYKDKIIKSRKRNKKDNGIF
ncbi:hypothetical protein HG438_004330 [Candidatus Saccharibacteria bacterium]|nr:hypothetical protein [Candidatus Saccharibacteria bacterium]